MSIERQKQDLAKSTKAECATHPDKLEIDRDNVEKARSLLAKNIGHLLSIVWLNGQQIDQNQH